MESSQNHDPIEQIYTVKERIQALAVAAGRMTAMKVVSGTIRIARFVDDLHEVRRIELEQPSVKPVHDLGK